MLQAMNTGHDGSLDDDPRQQHPRRAVPPRHDGGDGQPEHPREGHPPAGGLGRSTWWPSSPACPTARRRVTAISEITGMEQGVITMQDIFLFERTGLAPEGRVQGHFRATGIRPKCAQQLAQGGFHMAPEMFEHRSWYSEVGPAMEFAADHLRALRGRHPGRLLGAARGRPEDAAGPGLGQPPETDRHRRARGVGVATAAKRSVRCRRSRLCSSGTPASPSAIESMLLEAGLSMSVGVFLSPVAGVRPPPAGRSACSASAASPWRCCSALLGAFAPLHRSCASSETSGCTTFEEQFPEAIDLIARSLRAGHAFTTGLGIAAEEMPAPVGTEFKQVYDQQNFGMSMPDALRPWPGACRCSTRASSSPRC